MKQETRLQPPATTLSVSEEPCDMCGDAVTDGGSGREHDTYDCAVSLRSKLSAATARASELERLLGHDASDAECGCAECMLRSVRAGWRSGGKRIDELEALVAQRDTELAAMGTRAARAERQLKALDLLCGYTSEEDGTVVFRVLDTGERHCQVRLIPARGDDAGHAALALATKLKLIAPDVKGETNG